MARMPMDVVSALALMMLPPSTRMEPYVAGLPSRSFVEIKWSSMSRFRVAFS